ncbi:MAG: trypsin-like peptidase domain-containing protein [Firmicutes bacterium]|nr:trypsin-like peptidase domain-containing protein [Bacillota bacterium]
MSFESMRKLLSKYFPFIIVALVAAMAGGIIVGKLVLGQSSLAENESVQKTAAGGQVAARAITPENPNAVADVAEQVAPAVVKIETTYPRRANPHDNPFFNDPFFRQFFGDMIPQDEGAQVGLGSGFIFNKDGYILTNQHVVGGADKIKVTIKGFDKPFEAKLVGSDRSLDLAVLRIEAPRDKSLPTVELGDSDKLRQGEWVIAIGDPYGLDWTVTAGVVSAKGRPVTVSDEGSPRRYKNLIQTDAAINPGNSGGPLLNLEGQVVGINAAVNTAGQGLGFAIPINMAKNVLKDLMEHGKVVRAWLGVSIQNITPDLADAMRLPVNSGVIITDVINGGPADKAGLERGDIVKEFDGAKVTDSDQLVDMVQKAKIGGKVVLVVIRDGNTRFVTAKIEAQP